MTILTRSEMAKLGAVLLCVLAVVLMLALSACAPQAIHGPRNPFPKDAAAYNGRARGLGGIRGLIGINQARCFGGGIGGCGWTGKANDGPAGPGR